MIELYRQVPKELAANLEYRLALRRRASGDPVFRQAMLAGCRRDVIFFFNAFCWLYEPRPTRSAGGARLPSVIPFITWPHQDLAIAEIKAKLGDEDVGVEKSRGEGMSWIAILLALHDWMFEPMTAIGLVSRTENAVDNPDDSDSLMWKLDWELTKLPSWMRPRIKRNVTDHTLRNLDNGSSIVGYAATGDVASGGRKKWFLKDELAKFPRPADTDAMASTQHVTNSRLVVSTPKGADGEYHRIMHEPSSMLKVVLDWKDNPTRNRGLYELRGGVPVAIDPANNPLPANYAPPSPAIKDLFSRLRRKGFKIEGKQRSPWYDHECDRAAATPHNIAQELDRDYGGSMFRAFGHDFFSAAEEHVRQPTCRGMLSYDSETLEPEFDRSDDGPFLLWTELDVRQRPPPGMYGVSADISTGLGGSYTSNSVAEVLNFLTGEQVLEYAANTVDPQTFADVCIALCLWFHGAYLSWEANGPGGSFTKRVKERQYGHIYHRKDMSSRGHKDTKKLGWWTDPTSKEAMFGTILRKVKSGECVLHSDLLVKECGQYVYKNGMIVHCLADREDDSVKGKSHGDRVMSLGVGLMAADDRPLPKRGQLGGDPLIYGEPPEGTMAARQRDYEDSLRAEREQDYWDDRSNSDLANPHLRTPGLDW